MSDRVTVINIGPERDGESVARARLLVSAAMDGAGFDLLASMLGTVTDEVSGDADATARLVFHLTHYAATALYAFQGAYNKGRPPDLSLSPQQAVARLYAALDRQGC